MMVSLVPLVLTTKDSELDLNRFEMPCSLSQIE